jgi:NADH dehydrogenase
MKENIDKIVTVFGASGFLGRYVVEELAHAGYRVKAIARNIEHCKSLRTYGFVGQVVPIKGNALNYDTLPELIKNSYAVINMVGILDECGKQKFNIIHAQMPEKLALEAKNQGVEKFVHISAIVNEGSESKYARSKIHGEEAVHKAFPKATILKPSVIFGAEDNFFNQFAQMTKFSPFLPLIGGGKTRFQPVYVGDVAKAVLLSVEKNFAGKYELGGPKIYSFKKIMKLVMEFTGRKRHLLNLPFSLAQIPARIPFIPITTDQLKLLKHDNIVTDHDKDLQSFGIEPTSVYAIVPKYIR